MEIFFCETCGSRVTDFEVGRGDAVQVSPDEVYCKDCAPAGGAHPPRPKTPAPQIASAQRGTRPATRNIRRPTASAPAGAKRSFTVPVVIAMSMLMGVAAAVILASGDDEAGDRRDPPSPPAAPSSPSVPAETPPSVPGPTPAPAIPDAPAGELSVKDGLAFWVEAGRWIAIEPDGTVKSWSSMVKGTAGLYQKDVQRRPTRVEGPAPGRFAVRFDGKYDSMSRILKERIVGDHTVIIAFKLNKVGQRSRSTLFSSSGNWGKGTFQISVDGKKPGSLWAINKDGYGLLITEATTDFTIIAVRRRGTELSGRSGGKLAGTFTLKAREMEVVSHVILGINRGGNTRLSCDIAEVAVYNRALSDAEIVSVEDYLSARYSITLTGR